MRASLGCVPIRAMRPLVGVVTAFTIAHSITLVASALGFAPTALWFPPLVEVLIAGSIVYLALENIVGARVPHRWMIAFAFGLVHGFGFSTALREQLQFAGSHLLTSLAAFNVGVELAQFFHRMGSRVTVVEYNDRLLARLDPDAGALLAERLEQGPLESSRIITLIDRALKASSVETASQIVEREFGFFILRSRSTSFHFKSFV